jgi:hypothetical protein
MRIENCLLYDSSGTRIGFADVDCVRRNGDNWAGTLKFIPISLPMPEGSIYSLKAKGYGEFRVKIEGKDDHYNDAYFVGVSSFPQSEQ